MHAYVGTWSTCQRASVVYVPMCQKRARFSILRANVPQGVPMFQRGMPMCQRACQFFKHSSYEMLREISILYYYIKNSTLYLISYLRISCVCVVHINCIILYFLKLFCSLDRNGNIKTPGFYTLQVTREYCDLLEL